MQIFIYTTNLYMSIRNLMIRWYGRDTKYVPVVSKFYVLMIKDISQWLKNEHSVKKYIKIHFPKHFDEIYEHDAGKLRDTLRLVISSQIPFVEDKKIIDRLTNMIDKIFSDICKGDLIMTIKENKEYWRYFEKLIKPDFYTSDDK